MATTPTLPLINISAFLPTTPPHLSTHAQKQATALALASACANPGFFYLTDHGIPLSTCSTVLDLTRKFFLESSDEQKDALKRREPDHARGYQKIGENVTQGKRDWHEAVDLYREWDDADERPDWKGVLGGKNIWPRHPPELRGVLEDYISRVLKLGDAVMRAMGWGLAGGPEGENLFLGAVRGSFWVFRLIGYPPLMYAKEEGGVSCGEHTDYGCVTFLLADGTKGALEVQTREGGWINADPVDGAFVVNIGDMLERWTNGLWRSTRHRVVHRGGGYRISAPFFLEPRWDARVKPLRVAVEQSGGIEKYGEVIYGEHLLGKVAGNFYDGESGKGYEELTAS